MRRRGRGATEGEGDARLFAQRVQEAVLEVLVVHGGVWLLTLSVVPVAAAAQCLHGIARGEPRLCPVTEFQIVRRAGAAHPGGHPAGVHGIAHCSGSQARHRGRERRDEQLAVRVRAGHVSPPVGAVEEGPPLVVRAAAQVDQSARSVQQGREQVRGDDVDRHDRGPAPDPRVVDHGVQGCRIAQFGGDAPHRVTVREITQDDVGPAVDQLPDSGCALLVAGVHHDVMAGGQQFVRRGPPKPVRRACHQDPTHDHTALFRW